MIRIWYLLVFGVPPHRVEVIVWHLQSDGLGLVKKREGHHNQSINQSVNLQLLSHVHTHRQTPTISVLYIHLSIDIAEHRGTMWGNGTNRELTPQSHQQHSQTPFTPAAHLVLIEDVWCGKVSRHDIRVWWECHDELDAEIHREEVHQEFQTSFISVLCFCGPRVLFITKMWNFTVERVGERMMWQLNTPVLWIWWWIYFNILWPCEIW